MQRRAENICALQRRVGIGRLPCRFASPSQEMHCPVQETQQKRKEKGMKERNIRTRGGSKQERKEEVIICFCISQKTPLHSAYFPGPPLTLFGPTVFALTARQSTTLLFCSRLKQACVLTKPHRTDFQLTSRQQSKRGILRKQWHNSVDWRDEVERDHFSLFFGTGHICEAFKQQALRTHRVILHLLKAPTDQSQSVSPILMHTSRKFN
mmetsp:Transcript_32100/g.63657  ORF Transcript_32100/g.63657 Transcript_32100/m.63657 type:complete len:209 (-) Transcript_32100:153-779(-)